MRSYGRLIGPAAERAGMKKDALGHGTKDHLSKNTRKSQENMKTPIGECRYTLKRQCLVYGSRN